MKRNSMTKKNGIIFGLLLLSVIYFCIFLIPNRTGADDLNMLSVFEPDEFAQYPYLISMIEFKGNSIKQNLWRFVAYQHYYYGFPFYFFSAALLLPLKLSSGVGNV